MADQDEAGQVGGAVVVPGRMWWAMQRCGAQCSRDTHIRSVAYRQGGALGFGGVPLREPDGQRLPVDVVGGDPHRRWFRTAGGGVHVGARCQQPDDQRTPSPVVNWSGSGSA